MTNRNRNVGESERQVHLHPVPGNFLCGVDAISIGQVQ